MKSQVNPVVAFVVIAVILAAVGFFLIKKTDTSMSKEEASRGLDLKVPGMQQPSSP